MRGPRVCRPCRAACPRRGGSARSPTSPEPPPPTTRPDRGPLCGPATRAEVPGSEAAYAFPFVTPNRVRVLAFPATGPLPRCSSLSTAPRAVDREGEGHPSTHTCRLVDAAARCRPPSSGLSPAMHNASPEPSDYSATPPSAATVRFTPPPPSCPLGERSSAVRSPVVPARCGACQHASTGDGPREQEHVSRETSVRDAITWSSTGPCHERTPQVRLPSSSCHRFSGST